jgi:hypothetical protein
MKEIKGGFFDIKSGERHHATGSLVFLIQKKEEFQFPRKSHVIELKHEIEYQSEFQIVKQELIKLTLINISMYQITRNLNSEIKSKILETVARSDS